MSFLRLLSILVLIIGLFSRPHARADEAAFGSWTAVFLQGKLSDSFGWYFEAQTRLTPAWEFPSSTPDSLETRHNRLLIRPALRWFPTADPSHFQVAFGYGWTPNLSPERNEHRLWQQALLQGKFEGGYSWATRVRLEERQVELTEGIQLRARFWGRLHREFDSTFGLALWDELFWGLTGVLS